MNSVLDYARYEKSQIDFDQVPFELDKLINSIIFLLSAAAEKKQLVLSYKHSEEVPKMLIGDPEKLRQVLLNIITNAIKFTHSGHVTVTVKQIESRNKQCLLRFSVKDSGIGISFDEQQKIFEPYTQANNTITRHYGGTGMGLAICKSIVEQQNGTIRCESSREQGATFSFDLPLTLPNQTQILPPLTNENNLAQLKPLTVLVTDDLRINRKLLQGQLEASNHRVMLADSGESALALLHAQAFDLVLLDVHMPGMDGIETTHRIREGRHSTLPIVGITANVSEQKIEECIAAGMNLVIGKPVDQIKLKTAISRVLNTSLPPTSISTLGESDHTLFDESLVKQHLEALGLDKFQELYTEAKSSACRRTYALVSHDSSDFSLISNDAHALAGLCANFGFIGLTARVESIEEACKQQSQSAVEKQRQYLEREVEQAFLEFTKHFLEAEL